MALLPPHARDLSLLLAMGFALGGSLGARPTVSLSQPSPPIALRDFEHTAWTARQGGPDVVAALAQTTDGFLWVGTPQGLFRFDGVAFERFEPSRGDPMPSQNVAGLYATSDGELWIGYRFGGASRLSHGVLTDYGESAGLPSASLWQFARDTDDTLWAATSRGLFRFDGTQWHRDAGNGLPVSSVDAVLVDAHGTFWATSDSGLYARRPGTRRFVRRAASLGAVNGGSVRAGPDGATWALTMEGSLLALADADSMPTRLVRQASRGGRTLLVDHEGAAWAGGFDGLYRVVTATREPSARGAPAAPMTLQDGLSGNTVLALFEDRERNIWVGTEGGLDRFRRTKLAPLRLSQPVVGPGLAFGGAGSMWVGSISGPTYRIRDEQKVVARPRFVSCTASDAHGDVWLGSASGLWRAPHGDLPLERVPLPDEWAGAEAIAIARDAQDRLWITATRRGVQVRAGRTWHAFDGPGDTRTSTAVTITADRSGIVWLGYTGSRLVRVRGDSTRLFTAADGLHVGTVLSVHVRGRHVWVGGEAGVDYWDGTRFHALRTAGRSSLNGVSGIVERGDGELWLNGADGITRIASEDVRRALSDSTYRVPFERLDYHDGIDGSAPQLRPQPSALEGPDGRLWFLSSASVLWLDPSRIRRNPLPPPVQVTQVDANDHSYEPGTSITLPPRTTALRIAFTALSLGVPERTRFRYRFGGNDAPWQDAGGRRDVLLGNVGPGTYKFRVIAANEDGVWNDEGAAVSIVIPPTFVQSRVFVLLCVAGAVIAAGLLLSWRQLQVTKGMHARFDATLAERTRIAQELHDTLLQGFTGVTLQLYAVQRLLASRPSDAAASLARALDGADATLLDARHAVWDLRSPGLEGARLPDAFAAAAADIVGPRAIEVRVATVGEHRKLERAVEVTVLRIGREAIANAVAHAEAQTIEVLLDYAPTSLTLVVRDDGVGFTDDDAEGARRRGHWGLAGMRERAVAAGGALEIDTAPNRGTRVALSMPLESL